MNDKLIQEFKEKIDMQVEDFKKSSKLDSEYLRSYESGFSRGYICAIQYVTSMLEQNQMISTEKYIDIQNYIFESFEKIR